MIAAKKSVKDQIQSLETRGRDKQIISVRPEDRFQRNRQINHGERFQHEAERERQATIGVSFGNNKMVQNYEHKALTIEFIVSCLDITEMAYQISNLIKANTIPDIEMVKINHLCLQEVVVKIQLTELPGLVPLLICPKHQVNIKVPVLLRSGL